MDKEQLIKKYIEYMQGRGSIAIERIEHELGRELTEEETWMAENAYSTGFADALNSTTDIKNIGS